MGHPDEPGGLLVGALQLAIMPGAALGGLLLDHPSLAATLIGGTALLVIAPLIVGNGERVSRTERARDGSTSGVVGALKQPCEGHGCTA